MAKHQLKHTKLNVFLKWDIKIVKIIYVYHSITLACSLYNNKKYNDNNDDLL